VRVRDQRWLGANTFSSRQGNVFLVLITSRVALWPVQIDFYCPRRLTGSTTMTEEVGCFARRKAPR
jgi:hypothetical protein